jgi:hypothetical protein
MQQEHNWYYCRLLFAVKIYEFTDLARHAYKSGIMLSKPKTTPEFVLIKLQITCKSLSRKKRPGVHANLSNGLQMYIIF